MAEEPQDKEFLELWRSGDEAAARQLVDRYADRLTALARKRISERLASRIDPEDITQSVFRTFFLRAREGQFQVQGPDDLCKLLTRITIHKTLRQVAYHKRARRDPGQETAQQDSGEALLQIICATEPTPQEAAVFLDELEHFLAEFRPEDQQILALRMEGYTNAEIANKLGITDRTVRRLMERIRGMTKRSWFSP
jgi:RNA polymerase sigma factor (sigma-70 family)